MKNAIKIFVLVMMLIFASGCNSDKPDGITDEMYDTAVYVINVVDLYIDGESELEETYDKISNMNIPEYEDISDDDASVYISIVNIKTTLFSMSESIGTQTISDLKEERNELAEKINY